MTHSLNARDPHVHRIHHHLAKVRDAHAAVDAEAAQHAAKHYDEHAPASPPGPGSTGSPTNPS